MWIFLCSICSHWLLKIHAHPKKERFGHDWNQKHMKNVCNSICDYEYISEKWDSYLPILYTWRVENDWILLREVPGSLWDLFHALKRLQTMKTGFGFFKKKSVLILEPKDQCIDVWNIWFSWHIFKSFPCDFDSNHGQSFQFWLCTNLESLRRANAA